VLDIDREHPEYAARKGTWKKYRDLYAGGEQLKASAQEYLVRRQREPADVYAERLSRVFYENYVGSIVDWYAATLFRREPVLTFEGRNEAAKRFFAAFAEDADRKGNALADFFRKQFIDALVTGTSYTLVDFPRSAGQAGTRAEEDASGASRAYLVDYSAENVINWSVDEQGNFEWVVIRTKALRKESVEAQDWRVETRWALYDKETFRIFRSESAGAAPAQVDEGRHGLAKLGQVPLFGLRIPEGLWMLNRAGSLQLEHFNKSNALSWALTMGLFAMPVVYSNARFEVLYPTDVNQTPFNQGINYPQGSWTAPALDNLKTESFGFTFGKNLDKSEETILFGGSLGFGASQRSHLIGVGDATASWLKEARMAQGRKFDSVVLFALDQFCLIGYAVPFPESLRRSARFA
jgi:hypothetical protein